ncbi:MAG: Coq4 family protein [Robiginitomaculum sp.]|nr:Coq4 family protein [Robiginitomaculum sp.]
MRPLKALRHFRNLIRDKEDTAQVFYTIEALNGQALLRGLENFAKTEKGQARIAERRDLPSLLDDHDTIGKLPAGTVGAAYLDFMQREGLSAAGLVEEFDRFNKNTEQFDDLLEWYGYRLRDTHDLLHVLTGYGRDALGEVCVLGFSHGQARGLGVVFVAFMGAREIKKLSPCGAPVMAAMREGKRHGKLAQWIALEDIPALLAEPLEAARERLGILPPTTYEKVHEMFKQAGQEPMEVLAAE